MFYNFSNIAIDAIIEIYKKKKKLSKQFHSNCANQIPEFVILKITEDFQIVFCINSLVSWPDIQLVFHLSVHCTMLSKVLSLLLFTFGTTSSFDPYSPGPFKTKYTWVFNF